VHEAHKRTEKIHEYSLQIVNTEPKIKRNAKDRNGVKFKHGGNKEQLLAGN